MSRDDDGLTVFERERDSLREQLSSAREENRRLREALTSAEHALRQAQCCFMSKCEGQHKWPREAITDALFKIIGVDEARALLPGKEGKP